MRRPVPSTTAGKTCQDRRNRRTTTTLLEAAVPSEGASISPSTFIRAFGDIVELGRAMRQLSIGRTEHFQDRDSGDQGSYPADDEGVTTLEAISS
jgi:hypothetical protein